MLLAARHVCDSFTALRIIQWLRVEKNSGRSTEPLLACMAYSRKRYVGSSWDNEILLIHKHGVRAPAVIVMTLLVESIIRVTQVLEPGMTLRPIQYLFVLRYPTTSRTRRNQNSCSHMLTYHFGHKHFQKNQKSRLVLHANLPF